MPNLHFITTVTITFVTVLLLTSNPASSQDTPVADPISILEHLAQPVGSMPVPTLNLSLDVTELIHQKRTERYFPAELTSADGKVWQTEVRSRGKFRRIISEVPPMKLKFSKKKLVQVGLDTLNEVRIVLPTKFDEASQTQLLREYLAYQIYARLSDYHIKAHLIKLQLHDTHIDQFYPSVWAMLLEHEEELGTRLGGTADQVFNMVPDSLQMPYAAMNAVFQCMIGNTDWSNLDARNMYHLKLKEGVKYIPIPYDFDFSGLVNAPYATPASHTGLKNVRERILLTDGISDSYVSLAMQKVLNVESDLLALCKQVNLSEQQATESQTYLLGFFDAIRTKKWPVRLTR
jgi:hypothetical protein